MSGYIEDARQLRTLSREITSKFIKKVGKAKRQKQKDKSKKTKDKSKKTHNLSGMDIPDNLVELEAEGYYRVAAAGISGAQNPSVYSVHMM